MGAKTIEEQLRIAEASVCPTCGRACLNLYNLKLHQDSKGHGK
jgi:hypothetical protein